MVIKNKQFQNKLEKNNIFGGHLGYLALKSYFFSGSSDNFVVDTIKSIYAKFERKVRAISYLTYTRFNLLDYVMCSLH